ncbi:MAG: hypothetical protein NUV51_07505 [Sulfuricaulis sp.]|nr:hypothetical protein [Sulfuricaulis sp.]
MKKVFLLLIHSVFLLWGIPQIVDAKDTEPGPAEICALGGREVVFDVKSGLAYCCDKDAGPEDIGNTAKCYRIQGQGPALPDRGMTQPKAKQEMLKSEPKKPASSGTKKKPKGAPKEATTPSQLLK